MKDLKGKNLQDKPPAVTQISKFPVSCLWEIFLMKKVSGMWGIFKTPEES